MTNATQTDDHVTLPGRLLDVMVRHALGGVEAMLLLHLVLRWPTESFGDGTIIRLEQRRCGQALGVTDAAIDLAANRLGERRLVLVELLRGRRHVRLAPVHHEVGGLWPDPADEGAVSLPRPVLEALVATASRGRDAVLLLALLMEGPDDDGSVELTPAALADLLDLERRSVHRIVRRLNRSGLVRRTAAGFDLSGLMSRRDREEDAPTNGRSVAAMSWSDTIRNDAED